MGFWTKFSGVFNAKRRAAGSGADASNGNGLRMNPTTREQSDSGGVSTAVLDEPAGGRMSSLDPSFGLTDEQTGEITRAGAEQGAVQVPRNRQELFEELQKNYREVVDLIRKVNSHLDREQHRSARMMAIAERVEEIVPSIHDMPDAINTHATRLNRDVVQALRDSNLADERRTQRLENALNGISSHLASGSESQNDLIQTMAQFRETMGELSTENQRTGSVLRDAQDRSAQREEEMVRLISSSKRWGVIGLSITVGVAVVAIATAVVAIVMAM